jgi:hypothetical protein
LDFAIVLYDNSERSIVSEVELDKSGNYQASNDVHNNESIEIILLEELPKSITVRSVYYNNTWGMTTAMLSD